MGILFLSNYYLPYARGACEQWCQEVAEELTQRLHPEQETAKFANTGRDYFDVLHALNIVFSRELPQTYLQHSHQAYQTMRLQAVGMAKWKFRQGQIANGLRYMSVAGMTLFRAHKIQRD